MTTPSFTQPHVRRRPASLLMAASLSLMLSVGVLAVFSRAEATSTHSFVLDDAASLAAGELDGAAVYSSGDVRAGLEARRIALPDAAVAYSLARATDGTTYVGTGDEGRIYRLRGDELSLFAETGQLLVSALALGANGTLYAGTIPEGKVFAISAAGEMRELASLEGAQHVWALVYDTRRRTLFAGTGPEGRVFAVDAAGHASAYYDSRAAHIMSLALDTDGSLYAGTSDDALLLRLRAPGQADVVYDFPGNELRAIAVRGGELAVVANEMPAPAPSVGSHTSTKARANTRRRRTGKGKLFRVDSEGRAELLYSDDAAHFTAVELSTDGSIHLGVGKDGRVLRVHPDGTWATMLDVDERQVLGLALDGADPILITGDSGAIYRPRSGRPERGFWTSKVLDAHFRARFGRLDWRGEGQLELTTRSGNTSEPDDTWSDWSEPLTRPGPVHSAGARFVQVRASFRRDANAVLRAVELFYMPRNQRAVITRVDAGRQHAPSKVSSPTQPSSRYDLSWSVRNADSDALRYRLAYRQEAQTRWRPILREDEVLTAARYSWQTESLPDGWYVLEVRASDELANAREDVLTHRAESEPFRVDNHAPQISQLDARGSTLNARVVDSLGPIASLELAIDGRPFRPLLSADGILDDAEERVSIDYAARLEDMSYGEHIFALRARDAAGNSVVREIALFGPSSGQSR